MNGNPLWAAVAPHCERDKAPYASQYRQIGSWAVRPTYTVLTSAKEIDRFELCARYSWAVPTDDDIDWMVTELAGRSVVEIGAGTGYWAALLTARGVAVRAYDIAPPGRPFAHNHYHSPRDGYGGKFTDEPGEQYFPVRHGGPETAGVWPEHALFLSWPPMTDMAVQCLTNYTGDHLFYCGESWGGCTATDEFFELLETDWDHVSTSEGHVQWWGIHDELEHYVRTSR